MGKLIAVVYPDQSQAAEVFAVVHRLQNDGLLNIQDLAFATKDNRGIIKLHQSTELTGDFALDDNIWGLLISSILLNSRQEYEDLFGSKAADFSINEQFALDLRTKLTNDSSALLIFYTDAEIDRLLPRFSDFGGYVLETSHSIPSLRNTDETLFNEETKTIEVI